MKRLNHKTTNLLLGVALAPLMAVAPAAAQTAPDAARPLHNMSGTVDPKWGNIRTFWGDNSPLWGNIRTFWGDVNPYEGDLSAFWGNIRTFNDGSTSGSLTPLWGNIRTFSGDLGASWGNIRTFWGNIRTFQDAPQDYTALAQQIGGMVTLSQGTFGAAVQAQTGKSFADGFANPLLARYGIDLANPQSLATLDAGTREHFFLDWYDGLMNFSGADHVDHWMNEINWSPALTQTLGNGKDAIIGLLDFTVTGDTTQNIIKYSGISTFANGHGAAVASLMVAAHDGKGVMGIAPQASVVSYNPFDATQTAGWADIKAGILVLAQNKASVINMSLGVPGWTLNQGWNDVFADKNVQATVANTVFVVAAGNDGIVQTQNIVWNKNNPNIIIVGSVDPTGTISSFSNQPGGACMSADGKCAPGTYLRDHFIVAPGELILVDDGAGGVTRKSGTSFAAPLVSGTIALIHDRWPWLTNAPDDTVNIILKSAKDLGAPGTDNVYGVGELNVQAALSPLDWSKLTFKQVVNGKITDISVASLRATTSAQRSTWEANGVYFAAFEKTGASFRDFEIPLSSKLANQTVSVNGAAEQFMGYLTSRFSGWLGAPTKLTGGVTSAGHFTDAGTTTSQLYLFGDGQATLTMTPRVNRIGFRSSEVPFQSTLHFASADHKLALDFGSGDSGTTLGGQAAFGFASDYDVMSGGANPFLGFATGGGFARAEVALAPGLTVATGVTQRTLRRNLSGLPLPARQALGAYDPYDASAGNVTLDYRASSALSLTFGYTMLREKEALLGMQSTDPADLPDGSTTDAATMGAELHPGHGLSLAASATVGRTRAGDLGRSAIAVGSGGLVSSAYQIAIGKEHVIDRSDRLRFTLAQPMHVEAGNIDVAMVGVVDRDTGELGVVRQSGRAASPDRRHVAELIYGRSLFSGGGEVSLFGRADLGSTQGYGFAPLTMGGSFRMGF